MSVLWFLQHKWILGVHRETIIKQLKLDFHAYVNPLGANHTKWSNTLKQFVGNT